MSEHDMAGATALVTGASRGFGRGIATALSKAGAQVVGVARDRGPLEELRAELGEPITAVSADAADPTVAGQLIDAYDPRILVLNAGATPLMRPSQHHTSETFLGQLADRFGASTVEQLGQAIVPPRTGCPRSWPRTSPQWWRI
jgi:NAD(P)-dependent dehydrogenase (short-subunit alcohol dehydrogenase family)